MTQRPRKSSNLTTPRKTQGWRDIAPDTTPEDAPQNQTNHLSTSAIGSLSPAPDKKPLSPPLDDFDDEDDPIRY